MCPGLFYSSIKPLKGKAKLMAVSIDLTGKRGVVFGGRTWRADVVAYGRDQRPLLLAECKAPGVPIDQTTFDYLRGRPFAPAGDAFDRAVSWWRSIAASRAGARAPGLRASLPGAPRPSPS